MNPTTEPMIVCASEGWIVRVPKTNGKMNEFRCPTEQRARELLALLGAPLVEGAAHDEQVVVASAIVGK